MGQAPSAATPASAAEHAAVAPGSDGGAGLQAGEHHGSASAAVGSTPAAVGIVEGSAGEGSRAGGVLPPSLSFDVPTPLPPGARPATPPPPPAPGQIVVSPETLRRLQSSEWALVRWATDLDNCPSRGAFTIAVCSPLLPLFVGASVFDVARSNAIRQLRNQPILSGKARLAAMMRVGGGHWAMVAGGLGLFYLLRCSFKGSSDAHLRQDNSSRLVAGAVAGGVVVGAYGFTPFLMGIGCGAVLGRFVVPAFSFWTGVEDGPPDATPAVTSTGSTGDSGNNAVAGGSSTTLP